MCSCFSMASSDGGFPGAVIWRVSHLRQRTSYIHYERESAKSYDIASLTAERGQASQTPRLIFHGTAVPPVFLPFLHLPSSLELPIALVARRARGILILLQPNEDLPEPLLARACATAPRALPAQIHQLRDALPARPSRRRILSAGEKFLASLRVVAMVFSFLVL